MVENVARPSAQHHLSQSALRIRAFYQHIGTNCGGMCKECRAEIASLRVEFMDVCIDAVPEQPRHQISGFEGQRLGQFRCQDRNLLGLRQRLNRNGDRPRGLGAGFPGNSNMRTRIRRCLRRGDQDGPAGMAVRSGTAPAVG